MRKIEFCTSDKKQKTITKNKFRSVLRKQRIQRKISQGSYEEVCIFHDTDDIDLFKKRNCKVALTIVPCSSHMPSVNIVFDTGGGPDMLHEDIVERDWMSSMYVYE